MAEPFTVSAHANRDAIEVWARAQGSNAKIESKVGQDGQTVLYAKKMGRFEALFHRTTRDGRTLQARIHVDRALKADPPTFTRAVQGGGRRALSLGKFSELPETFLKSGAFKSHLARFGMALTSGDDIQVKERGRELADVITEELRKQPYSSQMRFALADSNTLANELLSTVVKTTREYLEKTGGDVMSLPTDRLDVLGGPRAEILTETVDRVLSNLSDQALSDTEIVINGQRYVRDEDPLGSGAFGKTYLYRANKEDLKKGNPETLVVKYPSDNERLGSHDAKVLGPLREARALVNASGTGASEFSGNVARFHSAIRGTDGSVLVVMRVEEGGSSKRVFEKALKRLASLNPQKKISDQQYENMTLTLVKDAIKGALRYREGGKVAHFDLKIDNVLVSKDGTGRVADPGASRGLGDQDPLDSPGDTLHFAPISYTAPEKLLGGVTTPASDIYSLGMTLLEALSKTGPLSLFRPYNHPLCTPQESGMSVSELKAKVMEWAKDPNAMLINKSSLPHDSLVLKYADLINQMTSPSPSKRPTLEQLLAHPLFHQPGQGSTEIRELIKSLALPKPPRPEAPSEEEVGEAPDNVSEALSVVPTDLAESVDLSRSAAEERDDAIVAYNLQPQSGTSESIEVPVDESTNIETTTVFEPIDAYVSVARERKVESSRSDEQDS
jgi:serine/threonine protein kinase